MFFGLVNKLKEQTLEKKMRVLDNKIDEEEKKLNDEENMMDIDEYEKAEYTLRESDSIALHDTSTQSDDDELEQLDSMKNGSFDKESFDYLMANSPPHLTSSPPMINSMDSNSWDSTGCESGIVVHDETGKSTTMPDFFANQFIAPIGGSISSFGNAGICLGAEAAGGQVASDSGTTEQRGAFRPVTRRAVVSQINDIQELVSVKNIALNGVPVIFNDTQGYFYENGCDKKVHPNDVISSDDANNRENVAALPYVMQFRMRTANNDKNTQPLCEALVARREPVRLIIHNPSGVRRASHALARTMNMNSVEHSDSTVPYPHASKRGRLSSTPRPSLDFDKMREQMVVGGFMKEISDSDALSPRESVQEH